MTSRLLCSRGISLHCVYVFRLESHCLQWRSRKESLGRRFPWISSLKERKVYSLPFQELSHLDALRSVHMDFKLHIKRMTQTDYCMTDTVCWPRCILPHSVCRLWWCTYIFWPCSNVDSPSWLCGASWTASEQRHPGSGLCLSKRCICHGCLGQRTWDRWQSK